MTAEMIALASTTSASGSRETAQNLLLGHALRLTVCPNSLGQTEEHGSAHLIGDIRLGPRHKKARWDSIPSDEEQILRPKHVRSSIAKVADGNNLHLVITLVTTIAAWPPNSKGRVAHRRVLPMNGWLERVTRLELATSTLGKRRRLIVFEVPP